MESSCNSSLSEVKASVTGCVSGISTATPSEGDFGVWLVLYTSIVPVCTGSPLFSHITSTELFLGRIEKADAYDGEAILVLPREMKTFATLPNDALLVMVAEFIKVRL